jgi:hypothetical protein
MVSGGALSLVLARFILDHFAPFPTALFGDQFFYGDPTRYGTDLIISLGVDIEVAQLCK